MIQDLVFFKKNESYEDLTIESSTSPKLLESLFNENLALEEKILKVMKEKEELQSKNLLNEQICNELIQRNGEIINENQEKVLELLYQLETKEKIIKDMNSINSSLNLEANSAKKLNFYIKVNLGMETINLYSKLEEIRDKIQNKLRTLSILNIQKKDLKNILKNLSQETYKIKALLKNPVNRKFNIDKYYNCEENIEEPASADLNFTKI